MKRTTLKEDILEFAHHVDASNQEYLNKSGVLYQDNKSENTQQVYIVVDRDWPLIFLPNTIVNATHPDSEDIIRKIMFEGSFEEENGYSLRDRSNPVYKGYNAYVYKNKSYRIYETNYGYVLKDDREKELRYADVYNFIEYGVLTPMKDGSKILINSWDDVILFEAGEEVPAL